MLAQKGSNQVYSSRALAQGNVIDVHNFFYPIKVGTKVDYLNVKYVVVSFASEKSISNGKISSDALHNTEVWKFVDDSTCPVLTNLNLNVKATAVRSMNLRPDGQTLRVQLFVGGSSGIPGELAFDDLNPGETDCESNDFNPVIETSQGLSYYSPYTVGVDPSYPAAPSTFYHQAIRKIKLTNIYEYTGIPTHLKIVQFMTDHGCLGKLNPGDQTGCDGGKIIPGNVWVANLNLATGIPGNLPLYLLYDTFSKKFHDMLMRDHFDFFTIRPVVDTDMVVLTSDGTKSNNTTLQGLSVLFGLGRNFSVRLNVDSSTNPFGVAYDFAHHAPDLDFSVAAPTDFAYGANNPLWAYPYRMDKTFVWKDEVINKFSTDLYPGEQVVTHETDDFIVQYLTMGPQAYRCQGKNLPLVDRCKEMNADNTNALESHIVPYEFKQRYFASSYRYGGLQAAQGFRGILNFAQPEPAYLFNDYFSSRNKWNMIAFRSVPSVTNNKDNNKLGLKIFSPDETFKGSSTISSITSDFSSPYYYHDTKNWVKTPEGYMGFDITDPQIIFQAGKKQNQPHQVYLMFSSRDFDKSMINGKSRTGGGVYICVAGINTYDSYTSYKSIAMIKFQDCDTERPQATQENPYPTGYKLILASDITNNGTYMTSPKKVTMSSSPTGDMIIDYVAQNGAIFTVNVTEKSGDNIKNWNRKSVGRSAECHQYLEAVKNDNSFWDSPVLRFAETVFVSLAIEAAVPEGGIFIDIGWEVLEASTDQAEEALKEAAMLKTKCSIK